MDFDICHCFVWATGLHWKVIMERQPIIQVRDLTARYGEETILEGVSFDVFEGEIFVILGGSGCGKSTLLNHLIGLLRPTSGKILINGRDITAMTEDEFNEFRKKMGVLLPTRS